MFSQSFSPIPHARLLLVLLRPPLLPLHPVLHRRHSLSSQEDKAREKRRRQARDRLRRPTGSGTDQLVSTAPQPLTGKKKGILKQQSATSPPPTVTTNASRRAQPRHQQSPSVSVPWSPSSTRSTPELSPSRAQSTGSLLQGPSPMSSPSRLGRWRGSGRDITAKATRNGRHGATGATRHFFGSPVESAPSTNTSDEDHKVCARLLRDQAPLGTSATSLARLSHAFEITVRERQLRQNLLRVVLHAPSARIGYTSSVP